VPGASLLKIFLPSVQKLRSFDFLEAEFRQVCAKNVEKVADAERARACRPGARAVCRDDGGARPFMFAFFLSRGAPGWRLPFGNSSGCAFLKIFSSEASQLP
jgi:hypothetical protein